MTSWVEAVPSFIVAVAVIFGPGAAIVTAAGARGWFRWALAAPVTFTVAGIGAIILALVGIGLNPWSFGAAAAIVAGLTWGVTRLIQRRRPAIAPDGVELGKERAPRWWIRSAAIISVAVAALTISTRLIGGIGSPTAIAQLFDNVFHLNAVAIVHSSGNGSSLALGNLTAASSGFYPAGFHDVVAIIVGAGVTDVSVAINAASIVLAALVWPISLIYLMTRLLGSRAEVVIVTGICAGLFAAFPYRLFSFGVLYPFMSGLTMLPVLVGLVADFFHVSKGRTRPPYATLIAVAGASPGIALTHPSVLVASLVLAAPVAVIALARAIAAVRRAGRRVNSAIVLAVAYLFGTAAVFAVVRPPLSTAPWDPVQDPRGAVGSIVLMSPGTGLIGWILIPLALIGAVRAIRRPRTYGVVLGMSVIGSGLYFASAAMWHPLIRDFIAGVWYRDTERVSALFAIASLPLIVVGALTLVEFFTASARRVAPRLPRVLPAIIALVVVGGLILMVAQRGALAQAQIWLGQSFGQAGVEPLLSADERALLAELPELVPADEVVLGDPTTGASLAPAFGDREALTPHIFGERSRQERLLLIRWDRAAIDPRVCDVVRELDAYWALDFGTDGVLGDERQDISGLDDLADAPGVEEVARVGDAALYEAAVCR